MQIAKKNRAFTIIELLLVIAILGILSTLVMFGLQSFREKNRDSARIVDVQSISVALEAYFGVCRQYPSTLATTTNNGCLSGTTLGTFLPVIPIGPLAVAYSYATNGAGNNYGDFVIRAQLEREDSELSNDLDGVTNKGVSLDCSDSPNFYYCLGSQ